MKLYELMDVMHDGQSSISIWDGITKYFYGYDDGLKWLKKEPLFQTIKNREVLGVVTDIQDIDLVGVCIRIADKEEPARDYRQDAANILAVLCKCRAQITINHSELEIIIAQELKRLEQERRKLYGNCMGSDRIGI